MTAPRSRGSRIRYQPFDWYETPKYYDIVFDADSVEEADFLEEVYRLHGQTGRRRKPMTLEPACGTGRLLHRLRERGWGVRGFDISEGMLTAAAERLPRRALSNQPMQRFAVDVGIDLAFNLVSSFKYVLTDEGARSHLACIADALKPGGLYVLGIHETDYEDPRRRRERWVETRDGTKVICNIQVWPAERRKRQERVRSRLVVTENGCTRGYESHWTFRTYDTPQLRRLLRSEPRLELVKTYGFEHRVSAPHELGGERLDHVLVLRRSA